jgi:metal-responsive CopG/Arc/MetJ family transcriptional regulator
VNIYLPKSLIERVDRAASEHGMSRSSFFGLAVSDLLARHAVRAVDLPAKWLWKRPR